MYRRQSGCSRLPEGQVYSGQALCDHFPLEMVCCECWFSRNWVRRELVYHEPDFRLRIFLLREGRLLTPENPCPSEADLKGQCTVDSQITSSSENRMYSNKSLEGVTGNNETSPVYPSPSGFEVSVDANPTGSHSLQNPCTMDKPDGLLEGDGSYRFP